MFIHRVLFSKKLQNLSFILKSFSYYLRNSFSYYFGKLFSIFFTNFAVYLKINVVKFSKIIFVLFSTILQTSCFIFKNLHKLQTFSNKFQILVHWELTLNGSLPVDVNGCFLSSSIVSGCISSAKYDDRQDVLVIIACIL